MTRGENESISIRPFRVCWIMAHDARIQNVTKWCQCHGCALVSALGSEWGIEGEAPNDVDCDCVEISAVRGGHVPTVPGEICSAGLLRVALHRGKKGERHREPRTTVDATVGEDLPVLGELELTLDQPVGEFSRLDRERTDIASHLLVVLARSAPKDHLEHTRTGILRGAEDESDQVRIDDDRYRTGRGHGEHCARDVDTSARSRGLTKGEVLDEERRNDVHRQIVPFQLLVEQVYLRTREFNRTVARRMMVSMRMHHHPGSISNQRWESFAEVGAA